MTTSSSSSSVQYRLETECLAALGRLASKFSNAKIDTIEQVIVNKLTECEVELHVVSCDSDKCVSLLLPIQFPTSCEYGDGFDECVLDNIQHMADDVTVEERPAPYSARYLTHFEEEKPQWWVEANNPEMKTACSEARDILNADDFQNDLVQLADKFAYDHFPRAAKVQACGPAGMILITADEEEQRRVIEYKFPSLCTTPPELKGALLGAVATVAEEY